jgi:hypothetical protein
MESFNCRDLKNLFQELPGLTEETMLDFIRKNNESEKLKRIPGFDDYMFISENNESNERKVTVWFSRIGFDKLNSQAAVTMGELFSPKAGSGHLFFMKKSGSFRRIERF